MTPAPAASDEPAPVTTSAAPATAVPMMAKVLRMLKYPHGCPPGPAAQRLRGSTVDRVNLGTARLFDKGTLPPGGGYLQNPPPGLPLEHGDPHGTLLRHVDRSVV